MKLILALFFSLWVIVGADDRPATVLTWSGSIDTNANNPANYTPIVPSILPGDSILINATNVPWCLTENLQCAGVDADSSHTGNIHLNSYDLTVDGQLTIETKMAATFSGYGILTKSGDGILDISLNSNSDISNMAIRKYDSSDVVIQTFGGASHYEYPAIIDSGKGNLIITAYSADDTLNFRNRIKKYDGNIFFRCGPYENIVFNFYDTLTMKNVGSEMSPSLLCGPFVVMDGIARQPRYNFHPSSVCTTGTGGFYSGYQNDSKSTYRFEGKFYDAGRVYIFMEGDTATYSNASRLYFCDPYGSSGQGSNIGTFPNNNVLGNVVVEPSFGESKAVEFASETYITTVKSLVVNVGAVSTYGRKLVFIDSLVIHSTAEDISAQYSFNLRFTGNGAVFKVDNGFALPPDTIEILNGGRIDIGSEKINTLITSGGTVTFTAGDTLAVTRYSNGDFDGTNGDMSVWRSSVSGSPAYFKIYGEGRIVPHYCDFKDIHNLRGWMHGWTLDGVPNTTNVNSGGNYGCKLDGECNCIGGNRQ